MLDERRAAILSAVVGEYIETAQPVGSGRVARNPDIDVSPATVRNDMAQLEQEGYLHQPHTSAGRIPTDKGYRFFVDSLVDPAPLDEVQRHLVGGFFARAHGALEEMLHDTSRLLSALTDYAAVVVGPNRDDATIRSVELVGLSGHTALVVTVLSNGTITKSALELAEETPEERLAAASSQVRAFVQGATLHALPAVVATGDARVDEICLAAVEALRAGSHHDAEQVFVGGASRMARAFDAVETVRQVLGILEQQYVVVGLLRDVLDRGQSVAIGTEHGLQQLAECSVVVAPYRVEGEPGGTLGVLGPTRMHYPQALAAVAMVSQRLGRHLSER
ncbi:MAG: heat-inducible transcriptional repressor HrcA [Acidimicrobiales bacterium]